VWAAAFLDLLLHPFDIENTYTHAA
jgi:hypothetical protein